MQKKATLGFVFALLFGCSTPSSRPISVKPEGPVYSPMEAIEGAASKPMGFHGMFQMRVKRAEYGQGNSKDFIFLNSEEDYRDRRCLTIRIPPRAVRDFLGKGIDPIKLYLGKMVRIEGIAEQNKIFFYSDSGIQSDKYYFQTHVVALSPNQISVLPE
jgi:hypothetical protein